MKDITGEIIGAAIKVHRKLGPGLLESAYQVCLQYELTHRGFHFEREKPLPIVYEGQKLDCGYRLDFLVEDQIILEIKSVEVLSAIHVAQLLSYLRLSNLELGLLINFNVVLLKDGIKRVANNFHEPLRPLRSLR
jgi:GxxExxY protein